MWETSCAVNNLLSSTLINWILLIIISLFTKVHQKKSRGIPNLLTDNHSFHLNKSHFMLHLRMVYCPNLFNKLVGNPELEIYISFTLFCVQF